MCADRAISGLHKGFACCVYLILLRQRAVGLRSSSRQYKHFILALSCFDLPSDCERKLAAHSNALHSVLPSSTIIRARRPSQSRLGVHSYNLGYQCVPASP